ncbi:hypothetical protein SAY87_022055 [Trapa incisa]|uniref:non-specific serine/threonine protein kinase n=1 Tax=Trapa incisa TaxID=236973 RepID=A0AAN7PRV2_9MYRT|nr:hypothetical protein SAY87_022055 [Trapa incisa]
MDRFWLLSVKISFQSMAFSTICIIIIINEAHAVDVLDYFDRECSSQYQPYAPNSTFETSLQTLLGSLIASTPSTGFNSTVVGDNDDRVYGHAMCRGDINSTACRGCLETAANGIVYLCNRTLEAIIWYELCQIQYSFKNFSVMVFTGKYSNPSYFRKNASDPDRLRSHWKYMMTNISEGAAVNSSLRMFATGEVSMSASRAVYGLVQCTRDISSHDCTTCLASAVGDLETCCGSTEGGTVMSINCNARFELFEFYSGPPTFMLTYNYSNGSKWKTWMTAVLALVIGFLVSVLVGCSAVLYRRRRNGQLDAEIAQSELFHGFAAPMEVRMTEEGDLVSSDELPFMDLALVMAATDNFSTANKLGQGGFGAVYKGVLPDGKEIAVKRLSKRTWQGLKEFQNEVTLIGRLKHRNLVRLLGWGMEGDEKLLIYEFMPNRSLDLFIFGPSQIEL